MGNISLTGCGCPCFVHAGAANGAKLRFEQVGMAQTEADAAPAEERIFFWPRST
jgi:hypothetical protein